MISLKPLPVSAKRFPQRKPEMTFILGMKSTDGLVLCSDSLESDGYSKSYVQKLYRFTPTGKTWRDARWGIAWGCAGDTPIIKRFSDKLLSILKTEKPSYDRNRLEEIIEILVKQAHEDYPDERLALVIALWGVTFWGDKDEGNVHERRLYSINERSNCLSVEENFAIAGMDTSLARFLLQSVCQGDESTNEVLYLASFVVSVMKEKTDGVGGPTQLLYYPYWRRDIPVNPPVTPPGWLEPDKDMLTHIETCHFPIGEVEQAVRQFCWSRFPHDCAKRMRGAGQS